MDVSIIIPAFNKAELTRVCLGAIDREMTASVRCEVLVVDNGSTDDTAKMLAEFPWIQVISNDKNRGFAHANNQAAAVASGEFILLLNNDTEPQSGWLEALVHAGRTEGVGVVGARLLFPDRTLQHAGVVLQANRFGPQPLVPYHYLWADPGTAAPAMRPKDYQIVTGACLLTPRKLYLELGGLDETYWNGYEDVDYCFKVLRRGLRVVYEPRAEVIHFESQSGVERFSRTAYNSAVLNERWADFAEIDSNHHYLEAKTIRRWARLPNILTCISVRVPKTTVFVHGTNCADPENWAQQLLACNAPVEKIVWAASGQPPALGFPVVRISGSAVDALRAEMDVRGDRYIALLDTQTRLEPGWLDELVEQIEWGGDVVAATTAQALPIGKNVSPIAADARCTLLALRQFPMDENLGQFETVNGAVCDFLLHGLKYEFATRGVGKNIAALGVLEADPTFESMHGKPVEWFVREDAPYVENVLRARETPGGAMASIIMLSWNAPQYTKIALDSIREHTKMRHEIIIVDNGSGAETTDYLRAQTDVQVIFNVTNQGFAKGCNQGIAAARGEYIVLLNNDVVVTEGWLESLVDAVRRDPATGVSAPRSNEIAGDQRLIEASYADLDAMHAMAARRAIDFRRSGYFTDRAIGFCLCIDRKVINQIGGIDEDYGTGNFEDDDFCMRVRAAGYRIYVCNDVFIHHFGSVSFKSNQVDYMATMHRNWSKFAAKWGYNAEYPTHGYDPRTAIGRGFDRAKHFVALPRAAGEVGDAGKRTLVLMAVVSGEREWTQIGSVVRRYLSAFDANDDTAFVIACDAELSAEVIGSRVQKMIEKAGIDPAKCADVVVSDESSVGDWEVAQAGGIRYEVTGPGGPRLHAASALSSRGRGDLRRLYDDSRGNVGVP